MTFEILKTGTFKSTDGKENTFSESDLDKIIEQYNPKESEAPIVVGHPVTSSPAFGWIESLKREGQKLIATAKDIVPEFKELLEKKIYKKRSVSLTPDLKLRHVGFLGGALPSVKGLSDLVFADLPEDIILETDIETQPEASTIEKQDPPKADEKTKNLILTQFTEQEERIKSLQADIIAQHKNFSDLQKESAVGGMTQEEKDKVYDVLNHLDFKIEILNFEKTLNYKLLCHCLTPAMKVKILEVLGSITAQNFSDEKFSKKEFFNQTKSLLEQFVNSIPENTFKLTQSFAEPLPTDKNFSEKEFDGLEIDQESLKLHKEALELSKTENISYKSAVLKLINKQ